MECCLVLTDRITKHTQVLEGLDPVTEELGPYVYSATHLRRIVEVRLDYNDDDHKSCLSSL